MRQHRLPSVHQFGSGYYWCPSSSAEIGSCDCTHVFVCADRPKMKLGRCDQEAAQWFLSRGFAVAFVLRRGYGETGGGWAEDPLGCSHPDYVRGGIETAIDIDAAVAFLTGQPEVKPSDAIVVGQSAGPNDGPIGVRAFLYENDMMMDLNTLIQPDSSLYLTNAQGINDRGEIAGTALDPSGVEVAFLAVPAYGGESQAGSSRAKAVAKGSRVLPENVTRQLTGFSRLAFGASGTR